MDIKNKLRKFITGRTEEEDIIYKKHYAESRKKQLAIQAEETAVAERKVAVSKAKERAKKGTLKTIFGPAKTGRTGGKPRRPKGEGVIMPMFKSKKKKKKEKDILDFSHLIE